GLHPEPDPDLGCSRTSIRYAFRIYFDQFNLSVSITEINNLEYHNRVWLICVLYVCVCVCVCVCLCVCVLESVVLDNAICQRVTSVFNRAVRDRIVCRVLCRASPVCVCVCVCVCESAGASRV